MLPQHDPAPQSPRRVGVGIDTFIVNLEAKVFQCFDKTCGQKGDVIDLWAALHQLSLRQAALDLVRTFGQEPCARPATEQRNG